MTPVKDQSGECDPQKRITKAADPFLRRLLVQCAHHLLGSFGHDCDVRRSGFAPGGAGWKSSQEEGDGGSGAKARRTAAPDLGNGEPFYAERAAA